MIRLCCLILVISYLSPVCRVQADVSQHEAVVLRQPTLPAWEIDITDRLEAVEAPADVDPTTIPSQNGTPYAQAISRESQISLTPVPEKVQWWKATIALPDDVICDRPIVVEFDDSRVLTGCWLNGKQISPPEAICGRDWSGGEGAYLLPVTSDFRSGQLVFRAARLAQVYPNGFGRARLRPATLNEVVQLKRPAKAGGAAVLKNLSEFPLSVKALTETLDYFGVSGGRRETNLTLEPLETAVVPGAITGTNLEAPWKTRYSLSRKGEKDLEFWAFFEPNRENWKRSQVVRLTGNWDYVVLNGPHGENPPDNGWKATTLPHELARSEWKSHWMWYRTRVSIPQNWAGLSPELWLPFVRHHAKVYADGRLLTEKYSWELPATIPLPARPGDTITLTIAVTDYVVGLANGVALPSGGAADLPSKGLAAPVSVDPPGLTVAPELLGLPGVRVAQTVLRPRTLGEPRLDGEIVIENTTIRPAVVTPEASLLDAGTELSRASGNSIAVPAGKSVRVPLPNIEVKNVRLWNLDDPKLYAVQVKLSNAQSETVDVTRERIGFRQIETNGDHFEVNGYRLNLNGGSHIVLSPEMTWPLPSIPYRIHRFYYPSPAGFMGGRFSLSLADELGFFLKVEVPGHDALHQSKYNFQQGEIWDRTYSRVESTWREVGNHPSALCWDVGNELWFGVEGEDAKMASLYKKIETLDPTRFVVNGGGLPNWIPGARVQDWHSWPNYESRRDWFFYHPGDRPDYQKTAGVFVNSVPGESGWTLHSQGNIPSDPKNLVSLGGPPILFSEGHYYESSFRDDIGGPSARVPLPGTASLEGYPRNLGLHALNHLASRRITIQNARVAGFPSSMIHVDRGVGRWIQPLAAFSVDRIYSVEAGQPLKTRFTVMNDLTASAQVHAEWVLWNGTERLATQQFSRTMEPGTVAFENLDLKTPPTDRNIDLRLQVRVWDTKSGAYFRDDLPITLFAAAKPPKSSNHTMVVFDPKGTTSAFLSQKGIKYEPLKQLSGWKPVSDSLLVVGSEALTDQTPSELTALGDSIRSGGTAIILDHREYPAFLKTKLVSKAQRTACIKITTPDPLLMSGFVQRDLSFWNTRQQDWISAVSALEVPSSGSCIPICDAAKGSTLLVVREGDGRALFSTFNMGSALGVEPSAERLLYNFIDWGLKPKVPNLKTLIIAGDAVWLRSIRSRIGLEGEVKAEPDRKDIRSAKLIVLSGADPSTRSVLNSRMPDFQHFLAGGGTLFVQSLDESGVKWLSELVGSELKLRPHVSDRAFPAVSSPTLAGLDAGSFFWTVSAESRDISKTQAPSNEDVGREVIDGAVTPLLTPCYLGEARVGKGRIIVSTLRSLDYPVRKPLIALSTLLSNAGAQLTYGGIASTTKPLASWKFTPVDLTESLNLPLEDDPAGKRGWHLGGAENDMRVFPKGAVNLNGVNYLFSENNGNRVIAIAGTKGKGILPSEVKGIKVNANAERIYFLHNSAWGVPGFIYRVYYKEDREKWIPGQPEPYVDVVVRPGENIADWWGVEDYERGDAVLTGATLAWSGQNQKAAHDDRKVGVFQMFWDNPHPEKTIESIDIISPGSVGSGQAFIFGITLANKTQ